MITVILGLLEPNQGVKGMVVSQHDCRRHRDNVLQNVRSGSGNSSPPADL